MNRENLGAILLASIFAVLIWLWAEGENREERHTVVEVSFYSPAAAVDQYRLRMRDPATGELLARMRINVELQGPNLALQQAISTLEPLRIPFADPADGVEVKVDLREAIQGHRQFASAGITVLSAGPPVVTVRVDEIISVTVPIGLDEPGFEFESIVFRPDTVTVRMPGSIWLGTVQPELGRKFVFAQLDAQALRGMRPGEAKRLDRVPLRVDDRVAALIDGIDPSAVTIELTLANRQTERERVLPVKIVMLPRDESLYRVEIDEENEVVRDVVLSGDEAVMRRIESGETPVYALVDLTSDELERGITQKQAEWWLPPGVTARLKDRAAGDRPVISFIITPQQSE